MPTPEADLLAAFETHSVEGVEAALDGGVDPAASLRGKAPVEWLVEMYTRSDRFAACLRALLDRGAVLGDPLLTAALLDDADGVAVALEADPSGLERRFTLRSAFTPLEGATPLHAAAEYGHLAAARALLAASADPDARAAVDDHGLGGQTPIFHTVNAARNRAGPVTRLLLDAGAAVDVRLDGIVWGRGFEWETTLVDVTPVSYAQAGLLPQMHRDEADVRAIVRLLLEAAGRPVPPLENVPNRYLADPDPGGDR